MSLKKATTHLSSLLLAMCMLILSSCASTPPPAPEPEPQAQAVDPFADFRGSWFESGTAFKLQSVPMANREIGVEVSLKKVEWTSSETRDGGEIREASAILIVKKGEERRRLRMDEGDSKIAFGATIKVLKAGEDYSERLMQYAPWVEIQVQ